MRKDHIQEILKNQKLNLVWVIQGKKQTTGFGKNLDDVPRIDDRIGGFYYMDENGKILGSF